MNLEELRNQIPDFGRDIRLNLESVLSAEGAPGLGGRQIWGIALASAYALENKDLIETIKSQGSGDLDDSLVEAAKAAATIMAMNNIYYRALHLMEDAELKKLPARLRMNVIGKPGIEKADFELMCFAVSALSGCGQCLTAHLHELRKASVSNEGAQSALKIASVLQAASRALHIAKLEA
jgi:alkyl hydroperoxide reductase subunit D